MTRSSFSADSKCKITSVVYTVPINLRYRLRRPSHRISLTYRPPRSNTPSSASYKASSCRERPIVHYFSRTQRGDNLQRCARIFRAYSSSRSALVLPSNTAVDRARCTATRAEPETPRPGHDDINHGIVASSREFKDRLFRGTRSAARHVRSDSAEERKDSRRCPTTSGISSATPRSSRRAIFRSLRSDPESMKRNRTPPPIMPASMQAMVARQ